jgi:hypothetical protein
MVMSIIFCIPLATLALFESQLNVKANARLRGFFQGLPEEDEDDEANLNPHCEEDDEGEISRIKFEDLVQSFPK